MSNKAIMWSQENCQYCGMAKGLLESKGYEVEVRKLGDGWTKKDLLEVVPHARSVPQVFVGDTYVGGFQELKRYLQ